MFLDVVVFLLLLAVLLIPCKALAAIAPTVLRKEALDLHHDCCEMDANSLLHGSCAAATVTFRLIIHQLRLQ